MKSNVRPFTRLRPSKGKPSRQKALRKLATILEDQMTENGLTEEEKNAKTADLAAFAAEVAASRLAPHSKRSKREHNVYLQA
jgi:hypothetical protein